MKKKFKLITVLLLVFIIVIATTMFWWKQNTAPVSTDETPIYFVVNKGASAEEIGQKLYSKNLIKSPLAFKIYVQVNDLSQKINAGEFLISKSMDLKQIIKTFQGGPVELWVTVPEGLRKEEIVEILIKGLGKKDQEALSFRNDFIELTKNKEGYLFPDTYLFPPDSDAELVVNKLTDNFESKYSNLKPANNNALDKQDAAILASIIERETKTGDERPMVAGILLKRLNTQGWLLQADATVQYAIGSINCSKKPNCNDWWPILTLDDLEFDSPYNSYIYKQLPPTPISNPGSESLNAALNPKQSDYWFYIHDNSGIIHYAKTITQHNQNIAKYLKK